MLSITAISEPEEIYSTSNCQRKKLVNYQHNTTLIQTLMSLFWILIISTTFYNVQYKHISRSIFPPNWKQIFEGNDDPSKEQLYIQAYMCRRLLQEMAEVLQQVWTLCKIFVQSNHWLQLALFFLTLHPFDSLDVLD